MHPRILCSNYAVEAKAVLPVISNKKIGSAIYAKKESTADIQVGDQVVDMDSESLYVHEVVSFDYGTNTAQVTGGAVSTIRLGDAFTRAVVTVPLIGSPVGLSSQQAKSNTRFPSAL